jgi:RNA polymerase sigma-70 factor (ECF subfamily)
VVLPAHLGDTHQMTTYTQERLRREREVRELVDELTPGGMNVAARMLESREDAEEAVQDALMRLLDGISRFRREARLSTWFISITVNECRRRLARRKPRTEPIDTLRETELRSPDADAHVLMEKADIRAVIIRALPALPEIQAAVVVLYYLEGLSCLEVGKILNLDRKVVGSYLLRARRTLRPVLEKGELIHGLR